MATIYFSAWLRVTLDTMLPFTQATTISHFPVVSMFPLPNFETTVATSWHFSSKASLANAGIQSTPRYLCQ